MRPIRCRQEGGSFLAAEALAKAADPPPSSRLIGRVGPGGSKEPPSKRHDNRCRQEGGSFLAAEALAKAADPPPSLRLIGRVGPGGSKEPPSQ